MAYIGRQLVRGQNRILDDISSSFNGSTTAFNLTVSSSSSPPASVNQLWIILGGVLQKPGTDFTVADAVITFTTAPASTLSFWGMIQGDTSDINSPADASVTPSKIANSGDFAFPADVRFKDADASHYVGLQAPSTVSSNLVWTLPAADGSANQVLKTDGSGALGWASDANAPEGTAVLSTGETGTTKYLRVDGDNTCSWQLAVDATKMPLAGGTFTGDVTFTGDSSNGLWDKSANAFVANLTGTASIATSITVADESTDTSCNVLFATAATGNLGAKSGTNLTFNSNTGALTATSFVGALTGNVTGNASGSAATVTGAAQSAITSVGTLTTLAISGSTMTTLVGTSNTNLLSLRNTTGGNGSVGLLFSTNATAGREKAGIYHVETHGSAHYKGDLAFCLNSASGGATQVSLSDERMRIKSGGDVEINDGNLIIGTSGHGIDFSAQTSSSSSGASATGEVLTHYEFGTWTPVVKLGTTVNSGTVSGAVYTRIGNLVTVQCTVTSITESGTGNLSVHGMPFDRAHGDPTGFCRWAGISTNGTAWPYIASTIVEFQNGGDDGYVGALSNSNTSATYNLYSLQLIYHC